MHFIYQAQIDVERESGPFASRDALGDELYEMLEGANFGEINIDESSYTIEGWLIEEVPQDPDSQALVEQALRALRRLNRMSSKKRANIHQSDAEELGVEIKKMWERGLP